ncbi:MAG: sulfotransferase [Verrucomicrobiia bacterium]
MNDTCRIMESDRATYEEAVQFNRRGLFLGGCPKSGTTLLLSLLDSHPQLVVLPEETFYLEDRRHYAALDSYQAKLRRLLEKTDLQLLAKGRFEPKRECPSSDARDYTRFDYQRFVALAEDFIKQPGMNDSLLFSEVIRAYAIVQGTDWRNCVRWIEKSTSNEVRAVAFQELFPDAKLIQMVRDPRAVFASRKKRLTDNRGHHTKAHRLVREWNRSAREIPRLRQHPDQFMVIRYTDLVRNPNAVMREICRFAGFDFVPAMLNPTRAGVEWRGNSAFQEAFNSIDSAPVDQWRDYLTVNEIWWIEIHCRKGMELAGFTLQTNGRFSLRRWFRRLPGESWGDICGRAGRRFVNYSAG